MVLPLLSDGVVEARKATGELFGLIGRRSAERIAEAALRFRQEDDIAFVTHPRRVRGGAGMIAGRGSAAPSALSP